MSGADYLIIGVLAFSILLGLVRGFVRESIALLAWLGGIWLAWGYAPLIEPLLESMPGDALVRTWTARAIILISVLILGWLLSSALGYLLRYSSLSVMLDRLLGALFGVLRGAVVIAVIVLAARFAQLDQTPWWQRSALLPYASECAGWIQAFAESGMEWLRKEAGQSIEPGESSSAMLPPSPLMSSMLRA